MSYHIVDSATKVNNFEEEHSKKPMVIWYYADWCGHCVKTKPIWKKLEEQHPTIKNKMILSKFTISQSVSSE